MADVTNFNVLGETINVKDSVAREYNWLYGKKIVVYGDSTAATLNNYWTTLSEMYPGSFTLTNRAVGGTTLTNRGANNGVTLIGRANDLDNFDLMFVCYGTNEWQAGHSQIYGTTNMFVDYCVREIVRKVQSTNNPPKLIFVTPFFSYRVWGNNVNINPSGNMLINYNKAICDTAAQCGCEYIDFYTTSGCNINNYDVLLSDDSGGIFVHETKEFSKTLAHIIWDRVSNTNVDIYPDNGLNMFNYSDFNPNGITAAELGTVMTGYACPPYAKLNAGQTFNVNNKTFTPGYYRFIGYVGGACDITIAGTTVQITQAGIADFVVRYDLAKPLNITFAAKTSSVILSGLRLFKVGRDPNMYYETYNSPTIPTTSHTLSGGKCYMYNKDNFVIMQCGNLTLKSAVAANTALMTWRADFHSPTTYFFFAYNNTKKTSVVCYITSRQLFCTTALDSGDMLVFPSQIIDIFNYTLV